MLLPSAFPFDSFHVAQRPATPQSPPPSSPSGLFSLSSCRALQAILGSRTAPLTPLKIPSGSQRGKDVSATRVRRENQDRKPLLPITENTVSHTKSQTPVKITKSRLIGSRTRKRNRADFEAVEENIPEISDNVNSANFLYMGSAFTTDTSAVMLQSDKDSFSTPKRQRRTPLQMPLGLSAQDFAGLDPTPRASVNASQMRVTEDMDMPAGIEANKGRNDESEWSEADDRMLVSTVLSKLNLSQRDWNECARKIGRDGGSLGRRWEALVGDGDVGLRRGHGQRTRPELRRTWVGNFIP